MATARLRQNIALARVIGGADETFCFHPLDQIRGSIVADR
jgi:hypothetical protein